MDFDLVSFSPSKGAVSGGTLLKIRGSNLDIGSKAMVYLDEVPCQVDSLQTTPNSLVCRTGFVPEQRVTQNLTVVIDGGVKQLRSPFFYTPDPLVHDIQPLKSFFSGKAFSFFIRQVQSESFFFKHLFLSRLNF